ncbi:MAG: hypothetical protein JWP44_4219 [Mucilaginibacter sp.]|jgi:hypothetical protein|nr:hypothetical protein [Mucilaginibacter sp.]
MNLLHVDDHGGHVWKVLLGADDRTEIFEPGTRLARVYLAVRSKKVSALVLSANGVSPRLVAVVVAVSTGGAMTVAAMMDILSGWFDCGLT